jgi:hypothetical protein
MRSDDPSALDGQAGHMHLTVARRDAASAESVAAIAADHLLSTVETEDLHRAPSTNQTRQL